MKERPIIFNTEMVKAILDGRKTQTRRVMKPQPVKKDGFWELYGAGWGYDNGTVPCVPGHSLSEKNPYGRPGDLLYVRETWKPAEWSADGDDWHIVYKAGGNGIVAPHLFDDEQKELDFWIKLSDELDEACCPMDEGWYLQPIDYVKWRPSIFMPKNAARIWLKVKSVRVERVQDISDKESIAEGIPNGAYAVNPKTSFRKLWDSINAKRDGGIYSWESNPWIWVVDFEVVSTNGKPEADHA